MDTLLSIEKGTIADAVAISDLILNNALVHLKPFYSETQWAVFKTYYSIETMQQKIANQQLFCAKQEATIVGTIALEGNYVVGCYTHIDYVQKGIGSKLLRYIETIAQDMGLSEIFLAASPVGVDFYKKYGWQVVEQIEINYLGIPFLETIMQKRL